ncbi:MAG: DUF86 domain-containing protein [Oscillospiraceae bacterium]|jgi:uncharacterized protein with HEPN domain|nr:DUF86 domain-containing protein [Oscillospiraceae bacterium]
MSGEQRVILGKIRDYAQSVAEYIHGMDYDAFYNDRKTMHATAFALQQIGELSKLISEETQAAAPHIRWHGIRGLRNRIVHDYEKIDLPVIWDIVTTDLPGLLSQINALLKEAAL